MIDWAALVSLVELRHHTPAISVRYEPSATGGLILFTLDVRHRDTGAPLRIDRSTWPAVPCATYEAAIRHLYACLQCALLHELAEAFHVSGVRVYDPHPVAPSPLCVGARP